MPTSLHTHPAALSARKPWWSPIVWCVVITACGADLRRLEDNDNQVGHSCRSQRVGHSVVILENDRSCCSRASRGTNSRTPKPWADKCNASTARSSRTGSTRWQRLSALIAALIARQLEARGRGSVLAQQCGGLPGCLVEQLKLQKNCTPRPESDRNSPTVVSVAISKSSWLNYGGTAATACRVASAKAMRSPVP